MDSHVASGHDRKVWLLALVPDIRFGRWLSALVLFTLCMAHFARRACSKSRMNRARRARFFCIIIAYIVPVYHLITTHTSPPSANSSRN
jgi:hypothetical protein